MKQVKAENFIHIAFCRILWHTMQFVVETVDFCEFIQIHNLNYQFFFITVRINLLENKLDFYFITSIIIYVVWQLFVQCNWMMNNARDTFSFSACPQTWKFIFSSYHDFAWFNNMRLSKLIILHASNLLCQNQPARNTFLKQYHYYNILQILTSVICYRIGD